MSYRSLVLVLLFVLTGCNPRQAEEKTSLKRIGEGDWKGWKIWGSSPGHNVLFVTSQSDGSRHIVLIDSLTGSERELDAAKVLEATDEEIVDVRWSPNETLLALEVEGEEAGLSYLWNPATGEVQALNFPELPGSRSPRWDSTGEWLFFVPGVLDLSDTEKGLFAYHVSERKIYKSLQDIFVSKGIVVTGGQLVGVSVAEGGHSPLLFAVSTKDLERQGTDVAHWDGQQGKFVASR